MTRSGPLAASLGLLRRIAESLRTEKAQSTTHGMAQTGASPSGAEGGFEAGSWAGAGGLGPLLGDINEIENRPQHRFGLLTRSGRQVHMWYRRPRPAMKE